MAFMSNLLRDIQYDHTTITNITNTHAISVTLAKTDAPVTAYVFSVGAHKAEGWCWSGKRYQDCCLPKE
jgi:hypothetical protein